MSALLKTTLRRVKPHLLAALYSGIGETNTLRLSLLGKRVRRRLGLLPMAGPLQATAAPITAEPVDVPQAMPLLAAFLRARTLGGRILDGDLERLHALAAQGQTVLCLGGPRELDQMAVMLGAGGAARVERRIVSPVEETLAGPAAAEFDTIVADRTAFTPSAAAQLTALTATAQQKLIWLDGDHARPVQQPRTLAEKLAHGERLRVVILNDLGFQYGAGVGARRQVQSFLLKGWDVAVVCWSPGHDVAEPPLCGIPTPGRWGGVHALLDVHPATGLSDEQIISKVSAAVMAFEPDLVVAGNLHGANWPLDLLPALQARGPLVIAYMHDGHWVSGRCAYPGACTLFHTTGCDATCPTATEYPPMAPERIADAWSHRARVFTGANAIPLVANSRWTRDLAAVRFGDTARLDVVHLAVDHHLFSPIDRKLARRLLGVAEEGTLVLLGAVNVEDPRKGGPLFKQLYQELRARPDLDVLLFGHLSEKLASAKSFGLIIDDRLMPLIFSAADLFIGTATEEAFGQTLMEASACGLPVIAFEAGGVVDVVENGSSGILLRERSVAAILSNIDTLLADRSNSDSLGQAGRTLVEQRFTLACQADAWVECLKRLCA
ncbi:MAG TPA: glycosyltransferase [Patescibacteria group bacterium]|nr:glycosyltransferase [Patescibacteria group bacterium]